MAEEAKVVEASDEIKFSEEELKELGDLQQSYQEKQAQLGQIAVQKIILNQQVEAIENRQVELEGEYEEVQQTERDLVQKLNEKYGPGQLDPQSGVFTPAPPQEEAPQG
jgi:chromosome segregation ATPase